MRSSQLCQRWLHQALDFFGVSFVVCAHGYNVSEGRKPPVGMAGAAQQSA